MTICSPLERGGDGKTKWRTARIENLGDDYHFSASCAFYSAQDEQRVSSYFNSTCTGFTTLISAQDTILAERYKAKKRQKEQTILAQMESVPALPGGLESWARRSIVPTYFVYGHARRGTAEGTCSSCGQGAELSGVKYKGKATCPHCGRAMTMMPKGNQFETAINALYAGGIITDADLTNGNFRPNDPLLIGEQAMISS